MGPPSNTDYLGRHIKCVICKTKFNHPLAFTNVKKTKSKWCHIICVQYISETWFDDGLLNNACNMKGIYPTRFEGQCLFCKRTKGAKVFCSMEHCTSRFHASCGILNNCMLEDIASPDEQYSNRVVYCHKHLPEIIEASGNLELIGELKRSQDLTASSNRNNLGWGKEWDEKLAKEREEEEMFDWISSSAKQRKKTPKNDSQQKQRRKRKGRRFAQKSEDSESASEENGDEEENSVENNDATWELPSTTNKQIDQIKDSPKDEITQPIQNENQKKIVRKCSIFTINEWKFGTTN